MKAKRERSATATGQARETAALPARPAGADPAERGGTHWDGRPRRLVQSVDRALEILDTLAGARTGLPLSTLAERMGLNVSTCHHLVMTLVHRGYATQDRQTRHYRLGHKVTELAHLAAVDGDLVHRALPHLQELNDHTGEAIHLAVLEADELVTLTRLDSTFAVRVDSGRVGKSRALHATATGKALLAYLPPEELEAIVARKGLPRFTGQTLCDLPALRADLARVRTQGYAEDREEFQSDVHCIGAPIRDHTGAVLAAVSCATPTMRMNAATHERIRRFVAACADGIAAELGYTPAATGHPA